MTPWDQAHEEAHSIACAIGCPEVDDITRALLEADDFAAEDYAEQAWRSTMRFHGLAEWAGLSELDRSEWRDAVHAVMGLDMPAKRIRTRTWHRRLQLVPKTPPVQYIAHHVDPPWAKRDNVMSLSQFEGTTAFKVKPEWL